jgi:type II secretory pathway pseudopilin PulG
MLEVVFAMALLGLVVMATMGAISFVHGSQVREQRTLAAAELANRLILMYIDDPNSPWNEGDTITWSSGDIYRWDLIRSDVRIESATKPPADVNQSPGFGLDRIHLIRARVWLDEESGGTRDFDTTTPNAEIARLMDPISNMSKPDTTKSMYDKYRGSMSEYLRNGRLPGWRGRDGTSGSSVSSGGGRER